jgi:hypothetical protein
MKCPKCGLENRPDAHFCKQCGQPLPVQQAAPPAHPSPPVTVCPACGATAKPAARFCPRCGKPLPAKPVQPPSPAADTIPETPFLPQPHATQPSSPPPMQPPVYAQPPVQPPPPSVPPAPERPFPRWVGWMAAIAVFVCVAVLVVAAIAFGPRLLGSKEESTATPTPLTTEPPTVEAPPTETLTPTSEATPAPTPTVIPTFDAQVTIAASATELQIGDPLTVTVTVINTGQVTFGNLRYQLLGGWEPVLGAPTGAAADHEVDVPPAGNDTATFVLEATQPGTVQIHANVTVDTREDSPTTRPVSSEYIVEVSVAQ